MTTELRKELKLRFFPFIEAKGFSIDKKHAPHFIDFRRIVGDRIQFVEIQWEKYGKPRFTLNFGHASVNGTICYGEKIPPKDVGPGQAPQYCRLHPNGSGSSTRHWFRQDRPFISALFTGNRMYPSGVVVNQLIELFAEVEIYFDAGIVGPHAQLNLNSWAQDVV